MKKFSIIIALTLLAAGCNPLSKSLPAGVIKSVNGGGDWQFSNSIKNGAAGASLSGLSISKLAFDPANREVLFAGSYTGGLYKSEDSAASWSNILSKIFVYDFAVSPADSKTIYAAGLYGDHGLVLKTTDGGGSWNQIYNEESTANPVRGIALNPAYPNQLVIGTSSGSLIKSSDGGLSWQLANNFNDQINRVLWQSGGIYVLLKTRGLFLSTGFADNFSELTKSLNKTNNVSFVAPTQTSIGSFSQSYVDFASPSLIYLTTNKGLYKTVDAGQTWALQTLPIEAAQSQPRAIAVSLASSNIVFTSVGSTIYKSLDGGSSWQTQSIASGGFINYILIDPQLPQIVYGGIYASQ